MCMHFVTYSQIWSVHKHFPSKNARLQWQVLTESKIRNPLVIFVVLRVGTTRRRAVFFFFFVSRVAKSRRVIVHNVSVLIIFIPMWPISHLGQLKGLFFRKSQSIFPLATISSQTMVVYFRFVKRKNTSLFVTPFQPAGAREGAVLDCDLTFKSIMSGGKVVEISLWNKIIIKKTLKIIFKNEKIYIRHEAKPNQTTKPKIFINKKQQKK